MANDIFANIAAGGIGGRQELLCEPEPKEFTGNVCELKEGNFTPVNTKKENRYKR